MREKSNKRWVTVATKRALTLMVATLTAGSIMTSLSIVPAYADSGALVDVGSATTIDMMVSLFGGTHIDGSTVVDPQTGCLEGYDPTAVTYFPPAGDVGNLDQGGTYPDGQDYYLNELGLGSNASNATCAPLQAGDGPGGATNPTLFSILPGLNDGSGLVSENDCTAPAGAAAGAPSLEWNGGTPVVDKWATSNLWPTANTGDWPASPNGSYGGTSSPNGSSDGKRALFDEENATSSTVATAPANDLGCFNIGRSSSSPSGPSGSASAYDTAALQYFAYALDAVSVLVGSAATANLPAGTAPTLSLQQIWDIYTCQPDYTNWSDIQVGVKNNGQPIKGSDTPVIRWWPQSGSGTLAFFQNMLASINGTGIAATGFGTAQVGKFDPTVVALNPDVADGYGDPAVTGGLDTNTNLASGIDNPADPGYSPTAGGCNNSLNGGFGVNKFTSEENTEAYIVNGPTANDFGAIMPFSVGRFLYQWNQRSEFCSSCGSQANGNWDTTLTIANLSDLGNLTNDATPYVYGDQGGTNTTTGCGVSATGCASVSVATGANPVYPATGGFINWQYINGSAYGNPFVTHGYEAIGSVNAAVVNEASEWYTAYGSTPFLVPGIRYLYNVVYSPTALNPNPDYTASVDMVGFNPQTSPTAVSNLCADKAIGPDSIGGEPTNGSGFPGGPQSPATPTGSTTTAATPASIILENGFLPLPISTLATAQGTHCRYFFGSENPLPAA